MSTSTATVFDKILNGELPCHRIYEDDHVLAFLDIQPLARGHTLVITKERAATVDELSDPAAAALGRVLPRLCRAILTVTGVDAYNLLVNCGVRAGQEVNHVHLHIIPRTEDTGLQKSWRAGKLDPENGDHLATSIREVLGG